MIVSAGGEISSSNFDADNVGNHPASVPPPARAGSQTGLRSEDRSGREHLWYGCATAFLTRVGFLLPWPHLHDLAAE